MSNIKKLIMQIIAVKSDQSSSYEKLTVVVHRISCIRHIIPRAAFSVQSFKTLTQNKTKKQTTLECLRYASLAATIKLKYFIFLH